MQTSKDSPGNNPFFNTFTWPVEKAGDPLANSLMGSFLIIVIGIFPDHSFQLPFMVQIFSSQAAHVSFTSPLSLVALDKVSSIR
jgi:hypothetical protein